jgi:type I restriction enzyme S subunit
LSSIKIPFPPLREQQAIAEALSDVDGLISALDALIAKQRAIKHGAMQELLTGQRRLPGFAGEWEVKTLGEVVDFLDGKRKPIKDSDRAKMQGPYPYYGASGIIDYVNDYLFDDNLILLGEDGENIISRNSRLVFQIVGKVWVNNHAHVLKPKPETDVTFLTEYLESLDFAQYNTGTAQPKLNQKVCSLIPVMFPPLAEQTAIAQILADMDGAIAALVQKRAKTVALKQGMMQALLTGQMRLV